MRLVLPPVAIARPPFSTQVQASVFGESPFDLAHHIGGSSSGGTSHRDSGSDAIFHCADAFVTVVAVDDTHGSPVQVAASTQRGGWGARRAGC